jgi:hypothetical protein
MRTLTKAAIALGFFSATAIGTTATVQAQGFYFDAPGVHVGIGRPHHRYYDYYGGDYYGGGGYGTWNGCRPGWTVQGGRCAPYKGPVGPYAPPGSRYPWQ